MTAVMCPDEQGPGLLPISGEHAPSEILVEPYASTGVRSPDGVDAQTSVPSANSEVSSSRVPSGAVQWVRVTSESSQRRRYP